MVENPYFIPPHRQPSSVSPPWISLTGILSFACASDALRSPVSGLKVSSPALSTLRRHLHLVLGVGCWVLGAVLR